MNIRRPQFLSMLHAALAAGATLALLVVVAPVRAQDIYQIGIDAGPDASVGCTLDMMGAEPDQAGIDLLLEITADGDSMPPQVLGTTISRCIAATDSFQLVAALGGGWPVGLDLGLPTPSGLADVLEAVVPATYLSNVRAVRLVALAIAEDGTVDALTTVDGSVGPAAIIVAIDRAAAAPALSIAAALLGVVLLFLVAAAQWWRGRWALMSSLVVAVAPILATIAYAQTFSADGSVGDWMSKTAAAVDSPTDAIGIDSAAEMIGMFAAQEGGQLFLRLDVDNVSPTCVDGQQNQDETDVDCGGATCPSCPDGAQCVAMSDCGSGVCSAGTCAVPACDDGVENGDETDVDCGGVMCSGCPDNGGCATMSDCTSGVCSAGTCAVPACDDGVENGDEGDTDCGGALCPKCLEGEGCNLDSDCQLNFCDAGICDACFAGDTLIAVEGGFREIQEVRAGNLVWAMDPASGERALRPVLRTFVHITRSLRHLEIGGELVRTTDTHPFWVVGRGWIPAGDLLPGDSLVLMDGELRVVESSEAVTETTEVFNLEVSGLHTYFVGSQGVLVHNKP